MNRIINFSYAFLLLVSSFAWSMVKHPPVLNNKAPLFIDSSLKKGMTTVLTKTLDSNTRSHRLYMNPKNGNAKICGNVIDQQEYSLDEVFERNLINVNNGRVVYSHKKLVFSRVSETKFGFPWKEERFSAVFRPAGTNETRDYQPSTHYSPQVFFICKFMIAGSAAGLMYWCTKDKFNNGCAS